MKLSVITDEISQDFEHSLDVLLEYGASGAELRGLWSTNIADLTEDQSRRAKSALQERGLKVACLATPFFKCDIDPEQGADAAGPLHLAPPRDYKAQLDMLERCVKLAHFFETPFIRVFSFWRRSEMTPSLEQRIADSFEIPLSIAEREGLTLALENEYACNIGSGAEAAHFMSLIHSSALKVCWDPGNAYALGETPYPDGYNAIRQWVSHVHLKDSKMVQTEHHGLQAKFCAIGQGDIDYPGQFKALKQDGYPGFLSLETHFTPAFGSGPDGDGTKEDGSRQCLAYLKKALDI